MPTRNVVLTTHQSLFVEKLVSSGRYQNASEVLREALRLIEWREKENEARLAALRAAAQTGVADMEAGHYHTFTDHDRLHRHLASLAEQATGTR
ncbi:MAG TPA: type II toxin-antitoxin system ParD family antitoxin [Desulfurivibrio alkaliphilus]|uniref:Type II toxin-antitoxin system ParD family antitoxin n=1 Tax=Desulfurivibrio alkaliphilus TaxID=427923 RepID=A0A7C2XVL3_9BACT|nr:type II toxin-antitoxin system ParD family antitoxin [Desulfurivibrio alkaliphilus]